MIWIICIFILAVSGCDQAPHEHHYTEIIIKATEKTMRDPHAGLNMASMAIEPDANTSSPLTWQVPAGWQETAGKGMRLASFHLNNDPEKIDCSIVSLSGMAGGLEANLRRWMGQIGLEPSEKDFQELIQSKQMIKTAGGHEAKIYDFSLIQTKAQASTKSIMVAMIPMEDATVFVKINGSLEAIKQHREQFLNLVKSVRAK